MSESAPDRVDAAVSYSRGDQARVEELLRGLRARGLTVWFDKDIPGGALWEEIIARKYRASGALLFFVSRNSLASSRCAEEVSTARTLGKPIIPVLLEPLKLPDELPDRFVLTLQARNTVDAHSGPPQDIEAAIRNALAGFGIMPGAAPATAPHAAVPRNAASPMSQAPAGREKENKQRGAAWIAFGGLLLALLLVGGAYFLFVGSQDRSAVPGSGTAADQRSISSVQPGSKAPDDAKPPSPSPSPAPEPEGPPPKPPSAGEGDARIGMDRASFAEGEAITLKVSGLPGNDQDYVAIAAAGAKPQDYIAYVTGEKKKEKAMRFRPIEKAGHYEARAFFAGAPDAIRGTAAFDVLPAPPVTLSLDKTEYMEGDVIIATVSGLPGNERDVVALAQAGAKDESYFGYDYARGKKDAVITLKPIMTAGKYEVRVYFDDTLSAGLMRASVAFEVKPLPLPTLAMASADFPAGAPIRIHFAGMPGNDKDWVSIAQAGAADSTFIVYAYTDGAAEGDIVLRSPIKEGEYEARAYFNDTTGDKMVRARAAFTVTAAPPVEIRLDAETYRPGGKITVTFAGMPGNQQDWLALAEAGDPPDKAGDYIYTKGKTEGSVSLRVPDNPGLYEIRAYFDDTAGDRTIRGSAPFRVEDALEDESSGAAPPPGSDQPAGAEPVPDGLAPAEPPVEEADHPPPDNPQPTPP